MSVNQKSNNLAYGLQNALQVLAPQPIIAKRDPVESDTAEIGTMWINTVANSAFILTSARTWTSQATGSVMVSSLDITGGFGTVLTVENGGDTYLGGNLTMDNANTISLDTLAAGLISIGVEDVDQNIFIGNLDDDTQLTLQAGLTGGIRIFTNESGNVQFEAGSTSTAGFTITNNAYIGHATITGQTINMGSSQNITINNSNVDATTGIIASVTNLNVSTNNGYLTVDGITKNNAGSFIIHVTNNGDGNITTADVIEVTFFVTAS